MSDVELPPGLAYGAGQAAGLLFATPDEWLHQLHAASDRLTAALEDAAATASREIEHLDDGRLAAALGLASPLLGGVFALQAGRAKDELRARLADAVTRVAAELSQLSDAVRETSSTVLGDPARLVGLGDAYRSAKASLDDVASLARAEGAQLLRHWGGLGAMACRDASLAQVDAMTVYSDRLAAAADLVTQAAHAIKLTWSAILDALIGLHAGLLGALASAFDVGNVLTFEVGPVLQLISVAIAFLGEATRPVRELNSHAETVGRNAWLTLGTSPRLRGGTHWPTIEAQDLRELSGAGRWEL